MLRIDRVLYPVYAAMHFAWTRPILIEALPEKYYADRHWPVQSTFRITR